MEWWITIFALVCAVFALPFGLLPSILFFRDLANGIDSSTLSKHLYAFAVWGGMLFAATIGFALAQQFAHLLVG